MGSSAADRFEVVDASHSTWLRMDSVYTVEADRVTLVCNRTGLGNYLATAPVLASS